MKKVITTTVLFILCHISNIYALSYQVVDFYETSINVHIFDMNDDGMIVGSIRNSSLDTEAFVYANGQFQFIGTLGGNFSQAYGINNHGDIVGRSWTSDNKTHAFLYSNGAMQDLGTLAGSFSRAQGINDNGQIVGSSSSNIPSPYGLKNEPFLYQNNAMQDLGNFGGWESIAYSINNHGDVVGYSTTSNYKSRPFIYTNGQLIDLEFPYPYDYSNCRASSINDHKQIIVRGNNSGLTKSFVYENGEWTKISGINDYTHVEALDINNDGIIVGNNGLLSPFVYENSNICNLNDLLISEGWTLWKANCINELGQIATVASYDNSYYLCIIEPIPETENNPPVANAGEDTTVHAWIDGVAEVTLDGTNSYDPDGDALEYFWYNDADELIAIEAEPNIMFGVGEYEVTLIVNDGIEDSEPNSCIVTVIEALEAKAKLTPQSLNRKSHRSHVIGRLGLSGYSAADIAPDVSMVLMPGNIEADRVDIHGSKKKGNSLILQGSFDSKRLMDAIEQDGDVKVTIAVQLLAGQWVYGTDTVKVK